jgi:hypothetical protein
MLSHVAWWNYLALMFLNSADIRYLGILGLPRGADWEITECIRGHFTMPKISNHRPT